MSKEFASETLAETALAVRRRPTVRTAPAPAKRISNAVVAMLVSVSLFAASAQPSMADQRSDNFAKALGAALILGLAISALDNKAKAEPKPAPQPVPQPQPQPKPRPRHEAIPTVPANCAIEIDSNQGRAVTVFSESCMRREGFDYRLPNCARNIRIYGRSDRVYSEQCLSDAGFRTRSRR